MRRSLAQQTRGRGAAAALTAVAGLVVAACGPWNFVGAPLGAPRGARGERLQLRAERKSSSDNFIDRAFTVMTDIVVASMPLAQQEKDAYQYYRDGMAAQTSGDYSAALRAYAESLKLEEDPIDRSYIFYNLGIIFANNGEYVKAVKYYHLALDQNKEMPQSYNNIAVVYHDQGTRAERKGDMEKARVLYDKAAQYWNQAIRIAPTNYLEAQNWLKNTGKISKDADSKLGGIW
mmetsp:Transcript_86013/g.251695  ORF Transcript_86013/g.251695 Transcript_86013/m.251695 type:complete len:233 (-) Transcript_86013:125-823(-)